MFVKRPEITLLSHCASKVRCLFDDSFVEEEDHRVKLLCKQTRPVTFNKALCRPFTSGHHSHLLLHHVPPRIQDTSS